MPKIEIIRAETTTKLQERVNGWINDNFENISEVYDIAFHEVRTVGLEIGSFIAVITYETSHGK